jgi:spoIIIJ-associated protein
VTPESPALPAEPAERVRVILERVVEALDLDADVEVDEDAEEITGRIEGSDLGVVIGRRGHTIDAIQLICYRAAFTGNGERKRVLVDAAGYRQERRETVERQAERAAERALETGKEIELEPMSPTERRIVHQHLKDRSGVETFSEGTEPERCVVVAPLVAD